ncbi:MAG: NAD(P)/FAD-dependent oxidoreductase [Thaumarchaeota archaeon]|nr:NAD(P)/FAD-dependent oxidoreductase [Nitrososphaerota archaeon]
MDYDVIVAGGGLAGMITAQSISYYSDQRLSILVVDRNQPISIGKKTINGWICGDAVSKAAVDFMTNKIKVKWNDPEIEHYVKGVIALSPDKETSIKFDGEGYMLNRKQLPQTQYKYSIKKGIDFKFGISVIDLVYNNQQVIGIKGYNNKSQTTYKQTSKVVVDATGMTSSLRNNIKNTDKIEKKIDKKDVESTGRHIMYFDEGEKNLSDFDSEHCLIHLDQNIAPGGYAWVFPKGKNKVNIGLGVEKSFLEMRNKKLHKQDNLSSLINQYVRRNRSIINPRLSNSPEDESNTTGTWQVSVRRQNDCMVSNGFIIIGDSAWMPKPLDAGGIGPAIIAGTLVGKNIVEAIESNDVTENGLWKYNTDFVKEYGHKTAGLEVFRRLLQTLTNEQISYGMKHFLGNSDIEAISKGKHPDFSILHKINVVIKSVLNKQLINGLRFTAKQNSWLTEHYNKYPKKPQDFYVWNNQLHKKLDEAYHIISKY